MKILKIKSEKEMNEKSLLPKLGSRLFLCGVEGSCDRMLDNYGLPFIPFSDIRFYKCSG